MTDSMSDQNVSDALTGIDIEQSLKNKFSTIGFADFQSEQTDIGNLRDLDDLGDNIPTIASESSGVISGSPPFIRFSEYENGFQVSPQEQILQPALLTLQETWETQQHITITDSKVQW